MPSVSIVTCTYNRAHLIGETIQSVLNQTFSDYEYLIIDDGSDDETENVVHSFKDDRIKFIKHVRTGGHLSKLRNFAHQYCQGEFIAYIDSDDLWNEQKLELQLNGMKDNPAVGFSFTDICIFNKAGIIKSTIYSKKGIFVGSVFPEMLDNQLIICHTTLLLKKSCLDLVGEMDESMHSGDHDLVFMLSRSFDAYVIYQPLVHVRKHEQNSTNNHPLSLKLLKEHHLTLYKLLAKNLITKSHYRKALANTSYSFGVQVLPAKDYKSALHYFLLCIKITPWNAKAWVRLLSALTKNVLSS